jgi:hypothetical protein
MSNRRLVPMPRNAHGRFVSTRQPTPLPPHAIFPKRRAVPPMQWPPKNYDVMALIATVCITAVLWEYRHIIFLAAACYFILRGWLWLCRRHPLIAWFVFGFLQGLLGSGRRRRW